MLPAPAGRAQGTVGLLVLRSYVLAGNAGHYDGVIADRMRGDGSHIAITGDSLRVVE